MKLIENIVRILKCSMLSCIMILGFIMTSLSVRAEELYTLGNYQYTVEDNSVTIVCYTGTSSVVDVPGMIAGNPVNIIAAGAFSNNTYVTTVNLPDTIMEVREGAFSPTQTVNYSTGNNNDNSNTNNNANGDADNNTNNNDNNNSNTGNSGNQTQPEESAEDKVDSSENNEASNPDHSNGDVPGGIVDDNGNMVTVDKDNNLIIVDKDGNETVIDNSQEYTKEKDDNGNIVITDDKGQQVVVDDNKVSFENGNNQSVIVDMNTGSKQINDNNGSYGLEYVEVGLDKDIDTSNTNQDESESIIGSQENSETITENKEVSDKVTEAAAISEAGEGADRNRSILFPIMVGLVVMICVGAGIFFLKRKNGRNEASDE